MRLQGLFLKLLASGASIARSADMPKVGLRILTYHSVGQSAYGDSLNLNNTSPGLFMSHLEVLSHVNFISLNTIENIGSVPSYALTFDDGYSDNLHFVAPLLVSLGIPFTVFVTANFVRQRLSSFLSPSELVELSAFPGVTIGAHGNTHIDLALCDLKSLKSELYDSRAYLEDLLAIPINTMSYPYGSTNRRVRSEVINCGYSLAACSYFGINDGKRDPFFLNRTVILNGDSNRVLRQKLRGDWDWYRFRMIDPSRIF